jgi:hypothetical protein
MKKSFQQELEDLINQAQNLCDTMHKLHLSQTVELNALRARDGLLEQAEALDYDFRVNEVTRKWKLEEAKHEPIQLGQKFDC